MKKTLSLVLSLCLVSSFFTGCGKDNNTDVSNSISKDELSPEKIGYYSTLELPIDNNNTEISIISDTSVEGINDSVVIKELRRRTGLNVQVMQIPVAALQEKSKVLLASGDDMPDIFKGDINTAQINEYGAQGAFEAVSDHIDELPNLKEIFYDKSEEYNTTGKLRDFMSPAGKLYIFPSYQINRDVNHGFLYRKDIFDKHGIKMWSNTDEFLDVLRQLKKLYPDSTPFASKTTTYIFRDFGYNWGLNFTGPYYDEKDGNWKMSSTSKEYKEVLDLIKTMYNEKLIDPEFVTATQAAWTQKMTQPDKAFVTWDWIGRLEMFKEQTLQTVPSYDLRYAEPLKGKVITLSQIGAGPAVKKSKKSVLAMKLLDYLLSESGARLMTMGIEGVTYTLDENGYAKYVGFEDSKSVGITDLEEKYGMFASNLHRRMDKKSAYYKFSEREQEAQDIMNKKEDGYWPTDPQPYFEDAEQKVLDKYMVAFDKSALEFSTKYVLSENYGDKEWNEWLAKAKSLGENEIIKTYNDAQARYDKL